MLTGHMLFVVGIVVATVGQSNFLWLSPSPTTPAKPQGAAAPSGSTAGTPGATTLSHAERITRLQGRLTEDRKQRDALQAQIDQMAKAVQQANQEFQALETKKKAQQASLEELRKAGKAAEADKLAKDVPELTKRWQLAQQHFELTIQERKVAQERLQALEVTLFQTQQALDQLTGVKPAAPAAQASVPASSAGVTPTPAPEPAAVVKEEKPASPQLTQARSDAAAKKASAQEAAQDAKTVAERIAGLARSIELERKLMESARQRADHAYEAQSKLKEEVARAVSQGTSFADQKALWLRLAEGELLTARTRKEVRERTDRLTGLQGEMGVLQQEQILALQGAERKAREARKAQEAVAELENPFTAHNMLHWLAEHGPRLGVILAVMLLAVVAVRFSTSRLVGFLVSRSADNTAEERENRAKTLMGVFHNFILWLIVGGGLLMILEECGIPIIPLLGGAAVAGLAIAFAAQNLLRDYFYGFVILLENQYCMNDVIQIGDRSGLVERITLRMTVLRDLEGIVHFIPHGQVTSVSNMTHGWSRALFNVQVAFHEDADRVMQLLVDLGKELRQEPAFADLILEDPEMLGVDGFSDYAVSIKFLMKTRPLKQWLVKREMLRRIKQKFIEQGIEFPVQQRAVQVRQTVAKRRHHAA